MAEKKNTSSTKTSKPEIKTTTVKLPAKGKKTEAKSTTPKGTDTTKKSTPAKRKPVDKPEIGIAISTDSKTSQKPQKETDKPKTAPTKKGKAQPEEQENGAHTDKAEQRAKKAEARINQYVPFFLFLIAALVVISYVMVDKMAFFGIVIKSVFYGLFGFGAFLIPIVLIIFGIKWQKYIIDGTKTLNIILSVVALFLVSSFVQLIFLAINNVATPTLSNLRFEIVEYFNDGKELAGGGVIGGVIGVLFWAIFGQVGSFVIIISTVAVLLMSICGYTPVSLALLIKYKVKEARERKREKAESEPQDDDTDMTYRQKQKKKTEQQVPVQPEPVKQSKKDKHNPTEDDEEDDDGFVDGVRLVPPPTPPQETPRQTPEPVQRPEVKIVRQGGEPAPAEAPTTEAPNPQPQPQPQPQRPHIEIVRPTPDSTQIPTSAPTVVNPTAPQNDNVVYYNSPDEDDRADYTRVFSGKRTPPRSTPKYSVTVTQGTQQEPAHVTSNDEMPSVSNDSGDNLEEFQEIFDTAGQVKGKHTVSTGNSEPKQIDISEDLIPPIPVEKTEHQSSPKIDIDIHHCDDTPEIIEETDDELEVDVTDLTVHPTPPSNTIIIDKSRYENYEFPPIDLLVKGMDNIEITEEEINQNIDRLMETLTSFKIRVSNITCSCGPTITRYEVKPELGIRVRSIANLVDDIAMGLAKSGVRIEAPIPGKSAVGIEVPNDVPQTVYLRSLIENKAFGEMKSKISACLGKEVSGKPVMFDIKKMPHLLIAGATGMGKSVCINSIIISLLYKAKPDEVKLILIDPKKVEFRIYKDIPHLYIPIVSDPKKAAGALSAAVAEMERRFSIIEEVGVRDIAKYNEITANDPDMEFMPQIVIIIDELADLMMTAPDEVESCICRLAQKARAAGMHIIIGTQRPSVDVITGLIKANVPSRIAFTVASQVDSRTIIDIGGAEKLIGRGDMLYAPVGAAKPMRVQGALVTDEEVESVVQYIISKNGKATYNQQFADQLEREAESCGNPKKGGGSTSAPEDDGDISEEGDDPKFREAVKIAVTDQKISTSLLQRKLSIGYGRAAKLIDRMQEMHIVSPPDGNKPRKILITKEQFMQMYVDDDI